MDSDFSLPANQQSGWKFGYAGDKYPDPEDREVLEVITALQDAKIPCFIVGTAALIYFGAGRVTDVRFALCRLLAILTIA